MKLLSLPTNLVSREATDDVPVDHDKVKLSDSARRVFPQSSRTSKTAAARRIQDSSAASPAGMSSSVFRNHSG